MMRLWDALPLATRTCIMIALLLLTGGLLLQCVGGAIAERLQDTWRRDGMIAVLVLVVAAEVAMIAGGEA